MCVSGQVFSMYMRMYICVYICTYICVYIRTYVYMYVHTYPHTCALEFFPVEILEDMLELIRPL